MKLISFAHRVLSKNGILCPFWLALFFQQAKWRTFLCPTNNKSFRHDHLCSFFVFTPTLVNDKIFLGASQIAAIDKLKGVGAPVAPTLQDKLTSASNCSCVRVWFVTFLRTARSASPVPAANIASVCVDLTAFLNSSAVQRLKCDAPCAASHIIAVTICRIFANTHSCKRGFTHGHRGIAIRRCHRCRHSILQKLFNVWLRNVQSSTSTRSGRSTYSLGGPRMWQNCAINNEKPANQNWMRDFSLIIRLKILGDADGIFSR
jgi:hypothetical protein